MDNGIWIINGDGVKQLVTPNSWVKDGNGIMQLATPGTWIKGGNGYMFKIPGDSPKETTISTYFDDEGLY
jgi:hypothetical protein